MPCDASYTPDRERHRLVERPAMLETSDVMTVEEARERFAGKWLALEVVSRDENHMPHQVRLIGRSASRDELCQETRSYRDLFIMLAGPVVPPGWGFVFSRFVR
jgi:hypothetical protein